jgi:hypothetical protein
MQTADLIPPYVVSIWLEGEEAKTLKPFQALATATSAQAREMAAALLVYAHLAEQANAAAGSPEPWQSGTYADVGNINFPSGQDSAAPASRDSLAPTEEDR